MHEERAGKGRFFRGWSTNAYAKGFELIREDVLFNLL